MRTGEIHRQTAETDITLRLNLDGGDAKIDTGMGFLDHMLTLFAAHGGFGLEIACKGDTRVDGHHSTEDIGIALGEAFKQAIGDKKGINRYGSMLLPMDETLVLCAVDLSGRSHLSWNVPFPTEKVGEYDTELFEEFFLGFTRKAEATLHVKLLDGENSHHIAEGVFKAFGHALRQAAAIDPAHADVLPSTKGLL
jgi:imidazoleglycerol-phosphate dehydratase